MGKGRTILGALVLAALLLGYGALVWAQVGLARTGDAGAGESASPQAMQPAPAMETAPLPAAEIPATVPPAVVTDTPDALPAPPEIDLSSWEYTLVNTEHLLSADYVPELATLEGSQQFDVRAVEALEAMIAAARAEGLTVVLSSSYRSYATQQYLFERKVAQYGSEEEAARIVAIPGSSEHQLGLCVDIVDQYYEYMNESLADTALSQWLYAHCSEYGFILRYPEDKQEITGIMFEPWHFRYVGQTAAAYIMENGLCLEEFWDLYQ